MATKQSFSDHVNELRLRLLVWFVFFIAASIIGFLKSGLFLNFLTKPLGEPLFYTSPMGGFNFVMQIAVFFGFLVALPVLIYEIIKFCQPVLSANVKKIVPKLVIFSLCLLIAGLVLAFYIFIPAAIHFLKGFGGEQIQALITTDEYFSFISIYLIGMAILFQMPVIILLINYISPLKIKQLMKWQKWMIVLSFIVAAILTPTPDPVNQTFMAAPIILLYEISILLVWIINRNRKPLKVDPQSEDLQNINKNIASKNRRKKTWLYFTLLLIIFLAIWSTLSFFQHRQSKEQNHNATSQIDVINQKIAEATSLADTNSDQAREMLVSINSQINELDGSRGQTADLKTKYNNLVSKINNVAFINQDSNVINVSGDTSKFIVIGKEIISTRQNSSDLYSQTLGGKDDAKIIYSFPKGSSISNLYFDEANDRILATTSGDRIFNVSPVDNFSVTEIKPPVGETWPKIKSITTYLNNIYILEDKTEVIWKYASSDGKTYQPKSTYLNDASLSNKDAKAIASDGSIYSLSSDGKVSKFLRGASDKFTSPILPKPDDNWQLPQNIFTNGAIGNIYIQDSGKIVEISKLGDYQGQFILLDKQISSAYVSQKSKMGWILSGDKIYQLDLR